MKPLFATLCGCLIATSAAADPQRVLDTAELDRIAAGACLAGSPLPCNDTPGSLPGVPGTVPLFPGSAVPLVWLGASGLGLGGCSGPGACASDSSASATGD
jgi:hypothetical protein